MKSIGIITILKVENYGAELQAYALQRKLCLMGYKAEIIDYLFYKNPKAKWEKRSRPFYPYPLKDRIKELLMACKEWFLKKVLHLGLKRQKLFDEFHNEFTKTSRTYTSFSELYGNPPHYDAYCVGSDQVWNPRCYTNIAPYFLSFAPEGSIKLSYASSFGCSQVPDAAKEMYSQHLKSLDHIAVRESDGVRLVKELSGKDAKLVLDPTLLLDKEEWKRVEHAVPNTPGKYILVYELRKSSFMDDLAKTIAKESGCTIVKVLGHHPLFRREQAEVFIAENVGPSEFIYLLRNANFVITNSFHGTAFSINFNKPFFSVLQRGRINNSRQLSLLDLCALSERAVYEEDAVPRLYDNIDFNEANKRLEVARESSENYLRRSIG